MAEEEYTAARDELKLADNYLGDWKKHLGTLTQTRGRSDPLAPYNMKGALIDIEKRKSTFAQEPCAPLGKHVSVKQGCEKYRAAAEETLGGVLKSIVVGSWHDSGAIETVFKRKRLPVPNIIIKPGDSFKRPRYNVSQDRPSHQHGLTSVEDTLQVDHSTAWNVLVDKTKFHATVLIEGRGEDIQKQ